MEVALSTCHVETTLLVIFPHAPGSVCGGLEHDLGAEALRWRIRERRRCCSCRRYGLRYPPRPLPLSASRRRLELNAFATGTSVPLDQLGIVRLPSGYPAFVCLRGWSNRLAPDDVRTHAVSPRQSL